MNRSYFIPLVIAIAFLLFGLFKLHDYGINWDSPYNFQRGQAILHFFLTGQKNYDDLSECNSLQGSSLIAKNKLQQLCPEKNKKARSFYQSSEFDYTFANNLDKKFAGHPPLAGIFAAVTNTIFYQHFGIMDDTDSHNLFSLFAGFLMVLIVGIWATQAYGSVAGTISALSLSFYPILIGERNFNFKDPPIAAFYLLTLYFFWLGIKKKRKIFIVFSALCFAISFSMKLNIIFAPFIMIPWLLYFLYKTKKYSGNFIKKLLLVSLLYPIFSGLLFYSIWTSWWSDPMTLIKNTIGFYHGIGMNIQYQDENFYALGFNLYPIQYFLFTTPILLLILSMIGIFFVVKKIKKEENLAALLWFLLFLIPLLRIILPGFSSYGGVRQILEFSSGMALLCGYGVYCLLRLLQNKFLKRGVLLIIIVSFIPIYISLTKIHPNENLYFNELIGGIQGAKEKNFPGWSESFGNSYYQGIVWLNAHAEKNAKLTYPIQGMHNYVPFTKVRSDIWIDEKNWSDTEKKGEYIIEPNAYNLSNRYAKQYAKKILNPIYSIKINKTEIGYVYKNDYQHTKEQYRKKEEIIPIQSIAQEKLEYVINLDKKYLITKIQFSYKTSCKEKPNGTVFLQANNKWISLPETLGEQYYTLPYFDMGGIKDQLIYYIPYEKASGIKIVVSDICNSTLENPIIKGIKSS